MLRPAIANEPDRGRRERLDAGARRADARAAEPALPRMRRDAPRGRPRELGAPTYRELYERFGFRARRARRGSASASSPTPRICTSRLRPALSTPRRASRSRRRGAGTSPASSARPTGTRASPRARWCPRSSATLAGLGIDLRAQENVHLDLEPRPEEDSARLLRADRGARAASCSSSSRSAGPTTGTRSSTRRATPSTTRTPRAELPVEARRLGDNAVTEGWAMLLELLVNDPAWLARRLDFARPGRVRAPRRRPGSSTSCAATRPSSSTSSSCTGAPTWRRCRRATSSACATRRRSSPRPADFLADVDAGFYASSYLRAWALRGAAAVVPARGVRRAPGSRGRRRARSCGSSGARASG